MVEKTYKKLKPEFYARDTHTVAKELLGKVLCREKDGNILSGRIFDVESYLGVSDPACHSYNGAKTKRTEVMYMKGGTVYVYLIYGMYYCLNVVTREEGIPEAVLVRGVLPLDGLEEMAKNRYKQSFSALSKKQAEGIADGPGKLCKAFDIGKNDNGMDFFKDSLFIADDGILPSDIIYAKRIGIDYAQEAKDYLWRYIAKFN